MCEIMRKMVLFCINKILLYAGVLLQVVPAKLKHKNVPRCAAAAQRPIP